MEVKKLLEEIELTENVANEDIAGWDPRTVIGKQMSKNQAATRLDVLRDQYRQALAEAAVGILLDASPDLQQEYAAFAEDEAGTITVDANEMYLQIGKRVFPSIGRDKLFTATQSALMFETIEEIAVHVQAPLTLTAPVGTPHNSIVQNEQECANLIRDTIRKAIGDGLLKLYIEKQVIEKALAVRYNSNVVPVVVVNATPAEVVGLEKALFMGRNFPVKLTGNVSKESVLKSLRQIKKQIQPNQ
jgi:hypothetical protein